MTHNDTNANDSDGVECPYCGQSYGSRPGLGKHLSTQHDDTLKDYERRQNADVECPTCGDLYKNRRGVAVHHQRIHGESIAGYKYNCGVCGEVVRRRDRQSEDEVVCCSDECFSQYYSKNYSGEDSPNWKGGMVEKTCVICKSSFKARTGGKRSRVLCGKKECHREYKLRTAPKREEHPLWKGGYGNDYGPNWEQQREKARERDNQTCQGCGVSEEEHWRELDVHHIKRKEWFEQNYSGEWWEKANKLDNLVTLCMSCHADWEGIPIRPKLIKND